MHQQIAIRCKCYRSSNICCASSHTIVVSIERQITHSCCYAIVNIHARCSCGIQRVEHRRLQESDRSTRSTSIQLYTAIGVTANKGADSDGWTLHRPSSS